MHLLFPCFVEYEMVNMMKKKKKTFPLSRVLYYSNPSPISLSFLCLLNRPPFLILDLKSGGTRVTQSDKHPTLVFSSGHDLTVCGIEPGVEPAWDSLSPSLSGPPPLWHACMHTPPLKINKH